MALRQSKLHATERREALAYRACQIGARRGLSGHRRTQNAPRLLLHGVAVFGRPDAQALLHVSIEIADGNAGQSKSSPIDIKAVVSTAINAIIGCPRQLTSVPGTLCGSVPCTNGPSGSPTKRARGERSISLVAVDGERLVGHVLFTPGDD